MIDMNAFLDDVYRLKWFKRIFCDSEDQEFWRERPRCLVLIKQTNSLYKIIDTITVCLEYLECLARVMIKLHLS